MPSFNGVPDKIWINEIVGVVTLRPSTGPVEHFIVWSEIGQTYTPSDRLRHGMWLSLLRDALADGREVQVLHGYGDAFVTSLRAYA